MRPALAVCLVTAALAVGACNNASPAAAPTSHSPSASPSPSPSPSDTGVALAEYETCQSQVGDFLDALHDLDSRLDVGLNFQDYSERVGDVKVAYDRVPINDMDTACLAVGVPAEKALNEYVKANNIWNDCIQDVYCSNDSITGKLQSHWSKASAKIDLADQNLEGIREGTVTGLS